MFRRCSRTVVLTAIVAVTYVLVCNIFTLYHLSRSKPDYFVHQYGLIYLGHLNTIRNWTCKPVTLSTDPLPLTALASYPGSGNTWLRHLLQQSTGMATGSEYVDLSLKYRGFPGEGISNASVLVIKTHEYGNETLNKYHKAVLLIREPKEALLAEFNRRYGGHLGHANKSNFKKDWIRFLLDEIDHWYQLNARWLNFQRPLHVIMFDQLKQNTSIEIVALLKFLNVSISSKELLCVIRNMDGHFKRPVTSQYDRQLFKHSVQQTLAGHWKDLSQQVIQRQIDLSVS